MSNGGFMSYTLACEKPEVFSAIASVTGTMSGYDWNNCDPDKVVPVMQISGRADTTVPIDGSITLFGGWGGAPGMEAVRDFWVNLNECQSNSTIAIDANYTTEYTVYSEGQNENEVWHYLVSNWGHAWPRSDSGTGFAASTEIWNFFSRVTGEQTSSNEAIVNAVNKYKIYPNPASVYVNIEGAHDTASRFELISMEGTLLERGHFIGTYQLDLGHLSTGMYFLKINDTAYKLNLIQN
jgi:polyhydroxybutyrate depolymerase